MPHRQQGAFTLCRNGQSVANGYVFPDGVTIVRWAGHDPSTVVWPNLGAAMRIHGHLGSHFEFEEATPDGARLQKSQTRLSLATNQLSTAMFLLRQAEPAPEMDLETEREWSRQRAELMRDVQVLDPVPRSDQRLG